MKKTTKTTTTKRTRHGKLTITKIIQEELHAGTPQPVAQTASPIPSPAPTPPPQLTNEVIFVIDDSGSMRGCWSEAVRQLNTSIQRVREQARTTGQRTVVSLYVFSNTVRQIYNRVPVESVRDFDPNNFYGGMTALASAMCQAIDGGLRALDANDPNKSYLLVVVTDGGENQSYRGDIARLAALIQQVQQTDRWTLACMVPRNMSNNMTALGVPAGNVTEWDNDVAGATRGFAQTNQGVSSFYAGRSVGQTSTKQFYTTNLSQFSAADLAKMEDLSHRFKKWEITKAGEDIKAFVEGKGYPFFIGAGYYLLMKPELLRAGRNVLVKERTGTRIYGGAQARKILGLPDGEVKVTPGNHSDYEIYFQSTSTNRKLVHGTKLYYDVQQTTNAQETWDSAAAKAAADLKKAQQQPTV